eukprot:7945115-Pyramimonas_sp.AAC.1
MGGEAVQEVDARYRVVSAPPLDEAAWGARERGRRGVRDRRLGPEAPRDLGVLKPEMEHVDVQSRLEQQFADFFGGVVSEWNPCYDNCGRCRF